MSPTIVVLLIVSGALLLPALLFVVFSRGERVLQHPRLQALLARLSVPTNQGPEMFFRVHGFIGAGWTLLGLAHLLRDGSPGWMLIGAFHLGIAFYARRHPEWWVQTDANPLEGLGAAAARYDGPAPDGEPTPASPVPEPQIQRDTWRRIDRPLSAAELRRAARGDKLEPIER